MTLRSVRIDPLMLRIRDGVGRAAREANEHARYRGLGEAWYPIRARFQAAERMVELLFAGPMNFQRIDEVHGLLDHLIVLRDDIREHFSTIRPRLLAHERDLYDAITALGLLKVDLVPDRPSVPPVEQGKPKWKLSPFHWAFVGTGGLMVFYGVLIWYKCSPFSACLQLPLNALGDVLAGFFAPLAFLLLATAVFIQQADLEETRDVMKRQANEAKEQAAFIGKQTDILTRSQVDIQAKRWLEQIRNLLPATLDLGSLELNIGVGTSDDLIFRNIVLFLARQAQDAADLNDPAQAGQLLGFCGVIGGYEHFNQLLEYIAALYRLDGHVSPSMQALFDEAELRRFYESYLQNTSIALFDLQEFVSLAHFLAATAHGAARS